MKYSVEASVVEVCNSLSRQNNNMVYAREGRQILVGNKDTACGIIKSRLGRFYDGGIPRAGTTETHLRLLDEMYCTEKQEPENNKTEKQPEIVLQASRFQ